ncbi:MAG: PAS domain S-box-containing protein [Salibacteraceae bacterium]|jgi:PAS domain S-box-containing protein
MHKTYPTIENMTHEELIAEYAALKESHSRYKEVFDSIVDVFTRENNDGYFEMVSPSVFAIFGYTAEELVGEKIGGFYADPNDQERLMEVVNRQGFCENVQSRVYTKQKDMKVISVNAKPYYDKLGNKLGVECVIRDITEQKKTEEMLNENAILLNESQRLAHLGHWHWDINKDVVTWSSELYRIYGLSEGDIQVSYEKYLELVHPEDRERIQSILHDALQKSDNQVYFEERILRENKEVRYLESWGTVVRKEDGTPLKMFGACLDITEKKLAEKKILESKKQFQDLFEYTPDARFIYKDDTIVNVNNAFLLLYGYSSKAEIIGKSIRPTLMSPEKHASLNQSIAGDKLIPLGLTQTNHLKKDGSNFVTEIQSSIIEYEGASHYHVISTDITERHEMEQEIQSTTLLLMESEKIAHLGHLSWSLPGGELKWSDEIYRICGVNFEVKPSIKHTVSLIHPDDWYYAKENLNLAIRQVKNFKIDHRIIQADTGEVKWVHTEMQLKFDSNGDLISLLGTVLDITERKKDQAALLQSEEEFRSIYENTYSGMPLIDLNGKFIKANQRFIELIGYSENELLNMTIMDVIHPNDVSETKEKLEALISGKIAHFEMENRYLKKSGIEMICSTALTAPFGINNTPVFLTASLKDITDEKKTQEILKAISEIQGTYIDESTPEEVFEKMLHVLLKITQSELGFIGEVRQKDGKPILVPHTSTEQFTHNPPIGLITEEYNKGSIKDPCLTLVSDLAAKVLTTGEPVVNSISYEIGNSESLFHSLGLPCYSNSELVGVICVANNKNGYGDEELRLIQPILDTCSTLIVAYKNEIISTTERLESERMKEAFTNELEIKVVERTKDLQRIQKELSISLEKEKTLSELKSRFVSTASHQFRTPLTVIQSNMGILSMQIDLIDDAIKPAFEKANSRIAAQIVRMTTMMNDVLILGKLNAGSIVFVLEPINLVELCREIIDNYNQIQEDQRKMIFTILGEPSTLNLDSGLISHAISNFVSNAFKYSLDRQGPEMKLVFNVDSIKLSIIDHGIGIPKGDLTNLFEPFYRASNVVEITGTGLGTSIAKEYVELNNGTIQVKSTIDEGSTFILTFKK